MDKRHSRKGGQAEAGSNHGLCIVEVTSHLECRHVWVQALHSTPVIIIAIYEATQDAVTTALPLNFNASIMICVVIAAPEVCIRISSHRWNCILRLSVGIGAAYLKWLALRFQGSWHASVITIIVIVNSTCGERSCIARSCLGSWGLWVVRVILKHSIMTSLFRYILEIARDWWLLLLLIEAHLLIWSIWRELVVQKAWSLWQDRVQTIA